MTSGYVYIMTNPSYQGMIKVGRTSRDSRTRARELSSATGVPTPFQVAFEIFSDDHIQLESAIHQELNDFRVSSDREFFRYPLDKTIALLQQLNSSASSDDSFFQAEDILKALERKYPGYLKSEIVAIRIVQLKNTVWLEVTEEEISGGYLLNQHIIRTDLAFIADEGDDGDPCNFFSPGNNVRENARKFVENFSAYSIIMTLDLFHEDACDEINKEYIASKGNRE